MQSLQSILKDNVKPIKTNNVNNVRTKAFRLTEKLQDPHSFKFYCKVAWRLPESVIEQNLEQALKGNNPKAYFTWLVKRQMN